MPFPPDPSGTRRQIGWRGSVAIAALLASLGLAGCGGERTPAERLQEADEALERSTHHSNYVNRAELRLELGDAAGALSDADQAVGALATMRVDAYRSDQISARALRARIHDRLGQHSAAADDYRVACDLCDTEGFAHRHLGYRELLGEQLCQAGRVAEADAIAAELLRGGPGTAEFRAGVTLAERIYTTAATSGKYPRP